MSKEHVMERDDEPFSMEELHTAHDLGGQMANALMVKGEELDLRPALLGAILLRAHVNLFLTHGMGDPASMMDEYKRAFVQIVNASRTSMKKGAS